MVTLNFSLDECAVFAVSLASGLISKYCQTSKLNCRSCFLPVSYMASWVVRRIFIKCREVKSKVTATANQNEVKHYQEPMKTQ